MSLDTIARDASGRRTLDEIIISSDSHVTEIEDFWVTHLPAKYREQAPVFKPRARRERPARWADKGLDDVAGGRDPNARIKEMEVDGVSAEVLFPTLGLRLFALEDAELQEACFRVFNDWLLEYCSVAPERLLGMGCISVYNIDNAIKELERCKKAGLKGAFIWQVPHPDLPFSSSHYDRFWAAASDMEMPVNMHILSGFNYQQNPKYNDGVEQTRGSVNLKTFDAVNSMFDFIFYGILERNPNLKIIYVENEIGWLPFMLQQWDAYYERHGGSAGAPITEKPSFYFERQIFCTFFDDPVGGHNFRYFGINNCMWSNDFPHPNSTWPNSHDVIERDLGHLPQADRAKLVRENVANLYKIALPTKA